MTGPPTAGGSAALEETADTGADRSVRHAGALMIQRALHVVAAAAFAVLVPRLMGPTVFGQYALLTSVALWFALLSGMGAVSLITRSVPRLVATEGTVGVRKLVTSLLALRGATGVVTASAYTALLLVVLGVADWVSVLFIAGAIWTRTVANICFAVFLGLNQAARWGAGDLLRRWLTVAFVLAGVIVAGLRGACAGFFAANLLVLVFGLVLARPYIRRADLDLSRRHLTPFLRIGVAFAAGNLLLSLAQRSGEVLVRLTTGSFTEVGYFGAAYSIYLVLAHALWQLAIAFAPFLITQLQAGRSDTVVAWLERLLKLMTVAAVPVAAGSWALGDELVPLILGADYQRVAVCLAPLTLALITQAMNNTGRLAALTLDRPGTSAVAAAAELSAFWILGLVLAPTWGSAGAAAGALFASMVYTTLITWRVRAALPYSLAGVWRALGPAIVFLPLGWLHATLAVEIVTFIVTAGVYACLLWRLNVVTVDEVMTLRRRLRSRRGTSSPQV